MGSIHIYTLFVVISLMVAGVISPVIAGPVVSDHSKTLEEKLDAVLKLYKNDGKLGLSIFSPQKNKALHSINADSLFRPASTLKLLVTSTALHTLGTEYQPVTNFTLSGVQQGSTFWGWATITGGGDPNISGRYFGKPLVAFTPWIDSLKALGIDTIRGSLTFDHSYYTDPFRPTTWKDEFFLNWYGAEVAALTFNDNCVDVTVTPAAIGDDVVVGQSPEIGFLKVINKAKTVRGSRQRLVYHIGAEDNSLTISGSMGIRSGEWTLSVPVKNPPSFFEASLRSVLTKSGITVVDGTPDKAPGGAVSRIAVWPLTTAPLLSLLDEINQRSQNLHAEMLLRNIGGHFHGSGSLENGIRVEQEFLQSIGIDSTQYHLLDGSGLSYGNRISPKAMTSVLTSMLRHPQSGLFYRSLAIPGISGVSGKRLPSLKYKSRVRFKTGFVNFTQGLVGYIQTPTYDTLAVALYLNEYRIDDYNAQKLMDSLWCEITLHFNQEQESVLKARKLWYPIKDTLYQNRLMAFSKQLMGEPYKLGPTGEGVHGLVERKPLINMFEFDCVTYIESVMALARAASPDSILSELTNIRYKEGQVYYSMRKHYFVEDWIGASPEMVEILRLHGDSVGVREMDKKGFYESKGWEYKFDNPQVTLNVLPIDSAIERYSEKYQDESRILGVGLVGKYPKIWVTHTGFLLFNPGKAPTFRHASFKHKKVEEVPFSEYLKSRLGSIIGIVLFEFKEPGGRQ
ncbi:MAG: D-alanyl-D-alanine carboxypeptidase/D-alanyl-D-alanine-endopeptidase [Fibrobacterales bacterium]